MPTLKTILHDWFRTKSFQYAISEHRLDILESHITGIVDATAERMRNDLIKTYSKNWKQDKAEILDMLRHTSFPTNIELWIKDSSMPVGWCPPEGWENLYQITEGYLKLRESPTPNKNKVE